jgi:hypothetical protein
MTAPVQTDPTQETGGACESMLSCKTNSAKLKAAGGPVSRVPISSASRGGMANVRVTYSRRPTSCLAGLAFRHFAMTARTSLQHGVFAAGIFFAGVECIGQPLISGAGSPEGVKVASAQWFESSNQLLPTRRVANQRLSMEFDRSSRRLCQPISSRGARRFPLHWCREVPMIKRGSRWRKQIGSPA